MATNKKYYFLKFKEDFFRDETIILLEDIKDGFLFSNILLKMYLLSLKDVGLLKLPNGKPYDVKMIATLIRHKPKIVEKAIEKFESLGLIEKVFEKNQNYFYMTNIEMLIGKSSVVADKKRLQRAKTKEKPNIKQPQNNTSKGGQMDTSCSENAENCPRENIDYILDNRDYIKECDRKESTHPPFLGKYQNISLTDEELEQLKIELPSLYQKYIDKLSEYMASTGKTYNSHIATIRKWAKEDSEKNAKTKKAPRNYDYDGDKSL